MKRWKKILIAILVLIFCSGSSFIIGSYLGFFAGWFFDKEQDAALRGVMKVGILRALRQQRIDDAIKILEVTLDGDILDYSAFSESSGSIFDYYAFPAPRNEYGPNMMRKIAKYRQEYPHKGSNSGMQDMVEKTLAKFSQDEPTK